jgi:hypothetical protein
MSEMAEQVRQAKEDAKNIAQTGVGGNANGQNDELPKGSSPVAASADSTEVTEEVAEESEVEATAGEDTTGDDLIRIGDKEFKTQKEAIAYAQSLEEKNLHSELYNQGVRDALSAQGQQNAPAQAEPEDNFEERFYSDPKGTLKAVEAKATQDALTIIRTEVARERQWDVFLTKYPDVRRKDAERVLNENWDTLGKMTDVEKAMGVLANKVRSDYEEIVNLTKPRTELPNKRGQVVSPSGGSARGVTQAKKDDKPLDFVSQMRTLKK